MKIKSAVALFLIPLGLFIGLIGLLLYTILAGFNTTHLLNKLPSELDKIPAYVVYGKLYVGNEKINIAETCSKEIEDFSLNEIFCISENNVYFLHTEYVDGGRNWVIASVDLKTRVITTHYRFSNVQEIYRKNIYGTYSSRNGFYYNNQIVLNDFQSVFVYDIAEKKAMKYDYNSYVFPELFAYGEYLNDQSITLHIDRHSYTFDLQVMADKSPDIAYLLELESKGKISMPLFFKDNHIQAVDGRLYAIESVLDVAKMPIMVILEYDQSREQWLYVTHAYVGDNVHNNCYVIPSTSKTGDGSVVP